MAGACLADQANSIVAQEEALAHRLFGGPPDDADVAVEGAVAFFD